MELGLERIQRVQQSLDTGRIKSAVVTVAGTNGKGSTVAYLESIYRAGGYKVGCYTSPHLVHFNERIRINGECVDDETLCQAFASVEAARRGVRLTYFEFTTLAALSILVDAGLDVILLEVGLGGRLDAVNIVDPDVAVVTAIDLDHQAWLGDTRELIGYEKAGIFRGGVPAVCSDANPPASVIAYANQVGATLYCIGQHYRFERSGEKWSWQGMSAEYTNLALPGLVGAHQLDNAAGALAAVQLLSGCLPVTSMTINLGLSQPYLPGRTEIVGDSPQLVLDVAHNPQATTRLAQTLAALDPDRRTPVRTVAVAGMLKDKDIVASLLPMTSIVDRWFVTGLEGPRAASGQQIAEALRAIDKDITVTVCTSVANAFAAALAEANIGTRIVIFGSFQTVGGIMPQLNRG